MQATRAGAALHWPADVSAAPRLAGQVHFEGVDVSFFASTTPCPASTKALLVSPHAVGVAIPLALNTTRQRDDNFMAATPSAFQYVPFRMVTILRSLSDTRARGPISPVT